MKVNEWAELFKFQMAEAEREEREKQVRLAAKRAALRADLSVQVAGVHARKAEEKAETLRYAAARDEDQRIYLAEEAAKVAARRVAMEKLRLDRDAQLAEKKAQAEAAARQVKLEEEAARRQVLIEHRKAVAAAEAEVRARAAAAAKFLADNAEQQRLRAEAKKREAAEAEELRQQYAAKLEAQEAAYKAGLEAMAARQRRQEAAGNAVGPYKRYIDDAIIQRNYAAREAALDAREAADKAKIAALRTVLKADLESQLVENKERKLLAAAAERAQVAMVLEGARVAEIIEREKALAREKKKHAARLVLEEQIAANVAARQVVTMSDAEKQINLGTLAAIPGSKITLPERGVLTYRQIPGQPPQTLKEMRARPGRGGGH